MGLLGLFTGTKAELVFFAELEKTKESVKLRKDDYLIGKADKNEQKIFLKDKDSSLIKLIGNKIVIRSAHIVSALSRNHGTLKWNKDAKSYEFMPLKSSKINGKHVRKSVLLKDKDKVELAGTIEFIYLSS